MSQPNPRRSLPESSHRETGSQGTISSQDYEHNSWRRQSECSSNAVAHVASQKAKFTRTGVNYAYVYHRTNPTLQSSFLLELTTSAKFVEQWKLEHGHVSYDLDDLRKHWLTIAPKCKWYQPKTNYDKVYLTYFPFNDPNRSDRKYITINGLQKMYREGKVDPIKSCPNRETVFVVICGSVEVRIEGNPQTYKARCFEEIHIPPGTGYMMDNSSNTCSTMLAVALTLPEYSDD